MSTGNNGPVLLVSSLSELPEAAPSRTRRRPPVSSPEQASARKIPEEHRKIIEEMRKNTRSLEDDDWGKK